VIWQSGKLFKQSFYIGCSAIELFLVS
jgi:hypothetical protein